MPRAGLFVCASSLLGLGAWAGMSQPQPLALPTPLPQARYQEMSARSPFAVATAGAASTAVPTPDFAAQLYVDGVAHIGQADFVGIKSRDAEKGTAIFLQVGDSTDDGMKVERVTWSDRRGKSTVDVSKGGKKATLIFDEVQMAVNADANRPMPDNRAASGMPDRPAGFPINRPFHGRGNRINSGGVVSGYIPGQSSSLRMPTNQMMMSGQSVFNMPVSPGSANSTTGASSANSANSGATQGNTGTVGNESSPQASHMPPPQPLPAGTLPQMNQLQWNAWTGNGAGR